jgi:hypothetical protein
MKASGTLNPHLETFAVSRDFHKPSTVVSWLERPANIAKIAFAAIVLFVAGAALRNQFLLSELEYERDSIHQTR